MTVVQSKYLLVLGEWEKHSEYRVAYLLRPSTSFSTEILSPESKSSISICEDLVLIDGAPKEDANKGSSPVLLTERVFTFVHST
jgi:hypothetical protein